MWKSKTILLFLLKAVIIYGIFSLPITYFDEVYGKLYRATCKMLLQRINVNGYAIYSPGESAEFTQINLGNIKLIDKNNQIKTAVTTLNTHRRAYVPTVLLISLVLASPISFLRKLTGTVLGFILISGFLLLKQWVHLLYICTQNDWLKIYEFTEKRKKLIVYIYTDMVGYIGPSLFAVVLIWMSIAFWKSSSLSAD